MKYTIKNDIIFNYLFSQSDVLKEFLEACLNKKIEEVKVTNQFSLKNMKYHDKVGVLDVKAKINKSEVVDIEMQRNEQSFYVQRVFAIYRRIYTWTTTIWRQIRGPKICNNDKCIKF